MTAQLCPITLAPSTSSYVLRRFEVEYDRSMIRSKFVLDTSTATVEETLGEFARRIEPYLSEADRMRHLTRSIGF